MARRSGSRKPHLAPVSQQGIQEFQDSLHPRGTGGRFADKPGAGNDAPRTTRSAPTGGGGSSRAAAPPGGVLTGKHVLQISVRGNPKRGTAAARFALYRPGMTVDDYVKAVGDKRQALRDIAWDTRQGWIKAEAPRQAPAPKPAAPRAPVPAPAPAPTPAPARAPAVAGEITGRHTLGITVRGNPKRGTAAARFALYRENMTVDDYIAAVGDKRQALRDIAWDTRQGWIKATEPKRVAVRAPEVTPPRTVPRTTARPEELRIQPGEPPAAAARRITEALPDHPRSEVVATAVAGGVPRPTADLAHASTKRQQPYHSDPEKRQLITDNTNAGQLPKPGTPARILHDKLVRAASVFKGGRFEARYRMNGTIESFNVRRLSNNPGEEVSIERNFSVSGKSVSHAYFQIGESERRTGAAKAFLAETVEAYRDTGIEKVTVHANIDVGGYAWIRYGFRPSTTSDSSLRRTLGSRLENERISGSMTPDQKVYVKSLVSAGKWQEIAAITTPVTQSNGTSIPLGRQLFLVTDWNGELSLKDGPDYDTFRRYAGAR